MQPIWATDIQIQALSDNTIFGDPISAFDFNAKAVIPAFKQRWDNSAHSYFGLFIKDAVPVHGVERNMLEPSLDDSQGQLVTY